MCLFLHYLSWEIFQACSSLTFVFAFQYTLVHAILAMVMMAAFQIVVFCLKAAILIMIYFLYAGLTSQYYKLR